MAMGFATHLNPSLLLVPPPDPAKRQVFEAKVLADHPLINQQVIAMCGASAAFTAMRPLHQETATHNADIRHFSSHREPPSFLAQGSIATPGIVDVDHYDSDGNGSGGGSTVAAADLIEVALAKDKDIGIEVTILAKPTFTPSSCASEKLVRGFNGLPGLGPWAIAGYVRIRSLVGARRPLELSTVTVKLEMIMGGRRSVAKPNEKFAMYQRISLRLADPPPAVFGPKVAVPAGGEYYGSFRFRFTQVYPPALDLHTACLHDTGNVVLYRLRVKAPGPYGNISFFHDVPVQLFSADVIRGWLDSSVTDPISSLIPSPKPDTLPDMHIKIGPHSWCVPGETLTIDLTMQQGPPQYSPTGSPIPSTALSSLVSGITQVTVSLVEVVGFPEGSEKSGSLRARATAKTCVASVATRELKTGTSAAEQTLSWNPSWSPDGVEGITASLKLRVPLAPAARSHVRGPLKVGSTAIDWSKTYPDVPSGCVNTDGRWIQTIIVHEICVAVHCSPPSSSPPSPRLTSSSSSPPSSSPLSSASSPSPPSSLGSKAKQLLGKVAAVGRAPPPPLEYRVPIQVVGVSRAAAAAVAKKFPAVLGSPERVEEPPEVPRNAATDPPVSMVFAEEASPTDADIVSGFTMGMLM
ncbi:hypothetical protein DFJ73DRAFT_778439 [Zopfochytrium polystomum]|nr:hypothetical protein DFJ73DRAFT_778439 [Zopfochytrium polystomum]